MATQTFKASLIAATFPFLFSQASRSVLVPGADVFPRSNAPYSGSNDNTDHNIIQMLYCENVIPIARGLMSVGFAEQLQPPSPAVSDFDQLHLLRDITNNNALFSPGKGKNYIYSDSTGSWISYSPFSFNFTLISKGYVDGRTFVFYERTKLVEYDPAIPDVVTRTLTLPAGYAIADIRGCSAASNYLLLFTDVEILWCPANNLFDFANLEAGAGRQIPIDLKGVITCIVPIAGGFLIYTNENVVAAFFTDNAQVPFRFKEVQGSGGVSSAEQVTGDANDSGHYAYGTAGLQLVTLQSAESVFPECTDFLVSKLFEKWNPTTKAIDTTILTTAIQPKLQFLGSRYVFISYGANTEYYEFALVYDTVLRRWGKLRLDHVDIGNIPLEALGSSYRYFTMDESYAFYDLAYQDLQQTIGTIPGIRQSIGFLQPDGTVQILLAEPAAETPAGMVIFGHIQVTRDRMVTVDGLEFDGLTNVPPATVTLLGSSTGHRRDGTHTPTVLNQIADYAKYGANYTAKNVDLVVEGRFNLSNAVVRTMIHGKR